MSTIMNGLNQSYCPMELWETLEIPENWEGKLADTTYYGNKDENILL